MAQESTKRGDGSLIGDLGPDGLLRRAFLRGGGLSHDEVRRRPVIGICNSWSELNPCNAGLQSVADAVKDGIRNAGGIGLEFPTISLSETFIRPTSMLLRNLMSMDVEEMLLSSPIDGVVLLSGCDKTVPAQLMGAISANLPAIMVTAGPRPVPCTAGGPMTIADAWPIIDERRRGNVCDSDWLRLESDLNPGPGTCNVMGTAVTMAAVAEVLGFSLPGSALLEAGSQAHLNNARVAGTQIVESITKDFRPSHLVHPDSLQNAMRVICALGGSTNAVIHLVAMGGRAGIELTVETLRSIAADTPLLANVRPVGEHLLSELHEAGGVPAIVRALGPRFIQGTKSADGRDWTKLAADVALDSSTIIAQADSPIADRSFMMLRGSLAPDGAVTKLPKNPSFERFRGRAVVFEGVDDLNSRIDNEDLDVSPDDVLVLRGVGPRGGPGIPEVGRIPIPAKLARAGVSDMVRITDARMSGTEGGTIILHVSPESAVGGPLALLESGDEIEVDFQAGTIDLLVTSDVLTERLPRSNSMSGPARGYLWLYDQHVLQANRGCDFDFLTLGGVEVAARA